MMLDKMPSVIPKIGLHIHTIIVVVTFFSCSYMNKIRTHEISMTIGKVKPTCFIDVSYQKVKILTKIKF